MHPDHYSIGSVKEIPRKNLNLSTSQGEQEGLEPPQLPLGYAPEGMNHIQIENVSGATQSIAMRNIDLQLVSTLTFERSLILLLSLSPRTRADGESSITVIRDMRSLKEQHIQVDIIEPSRLSISNHSSSKHTTSQHKLFRIALTHCQ